MGKCLYNTGFINSRFVLIIISTEQRWSMLNTILFCIENTNIIMQSLLCKNLFLNNTFATIGANEFKPTYK